MENLKIIIIAEGFKESVLRDVFTFMTLSGLIGLGWFIESDAMQWIGGLMGLAFTAAKGAAVVLGHNKQLTISEARAKLDEMEQAR